MTNLVGRTFGNLPPRGKDANHLGNVDYRTGKKIDWKYQAQRATKTPETAPFINSPVHRRNWNDILKV